MIEDLPLSLVNWSRIKTASRSSLSHETLSKYLYVNMNMPPPTKFDSREADNRCLTMKKIRNREAVKAEKQEWFKRAFDCNSSTNLYIDDGSLHSASASTTTALVPAAITTSITNRFRYCIIVLINHYSSEFLTIPSILLNF